MIHFSNDDLVTALLTKHENLLKEEQRVWDEVGEYEFFNGAGRRFTVELDELFEFFDKVGFEPLLIINTEE